MAACPLCSDRPAKRYCPAKGDRICAVCCGTNREIEIDCPGSCPYLRSGRDYEAEKRDPDPELTAKAHRFDRAFLYRFSPILDAISRDVVAEHLQSPWLVDNDVIEVYKALTSTMKTLSSGIYYESVPAGSVQQSLFHRLKALLDVAMQPQEAPDQSCLKVTEALDILEFLTFAAQANSGIRPKSRRYLDWLTSMVPVDAGPELSSGGLILP